jgi:hypothetical protein
VLAHRVAFLIDIAVVTRSNETRWNERASGPLAILTRPWVLTEHRARMKETPACIPEKQPAKRAKHGSSQCLNRTRWEPRSV